MSDGDVIIGHSIADTWEDSIRLLLSRQSVSTIDTDTGGATIEAEGILLRILHPLAEPRVSSRFVDPQLIEGYKSLFGKPSHRRPQEVLTVADRIYAWPMSSGKSLDQMRRVISELRANPTSRRAIIQIWDPQSDLTAKPNATPSGHCFFYFSIRNDALNLTATSRSIDAWNGGLPNMLTLAALQQEVAGRLTLPVGTYSHFVISYHIYVRDIPNAVSAFSGGTHE